MPQYHSSEITFPFNKLYIHICTDVVTLFNDLSVEDQYSTALYVYISKSPNFNQANPLIQVHLSSSNPNANEEAFSLHVLNLSACKSAYIDDFASPHTYTLRSTLYSVVLPYFRNRPKFHPTPYIDVAEITTSTPFAIMQSNSTVSQKIEYLRGHYHSYDQCMKCSTDRLFHEYFHLLSALTHCFEEQISQSSTSLSFGRILPFLIPTLQTITTKPMIDKAVIAKNINLLDEEFKSISKTLSEVTCILHTEYGTQCSVPLTNSNITALYDQFASENDPNKLATQLQLKLFEFDSLIQSICLVSKIISVESIAHIPIFAHNFIDSLCKELLKKRPESYEIKSTLIDTSLFKLLPTLTEAQKKSSTNMYIAEEISSDSLFFQEKKQLASTYESIIQKIYQAIDEFRTYTAPADFPPSTTPPTPSTSPNPVPAANLKILSALEEAQKSLDAYVDDTHLRLQHFLSELKKRHPFPDLSAYDLETPHFSAATTQQLAEGRLLEINETLKKQLVKTLPKELYQEFTVRHTYLSLAIQACKGILLTQAT